MYPIAYLAREGFTEQDIWREALGDAEPLRPFASADGPQPLTVNRTPWID